MPGMASGPSGGFPAPPVGGLPSYGPTGGLPGMAVAAAQPTVLPAIPIAPPDVPAPSALGSTIACPRCGTQTPLGFAYCQQCGLHMQAMAHDPAARLRSPSVAPPLPRVVPLGAAVPSGAIDPHAGTMAQDERQPGSSSAAGPSWGTAVLVNRDGSDGQRFPLAGEYLVIGRDGSDIAFNDDRFLARQHARLERASDGTVRIHALDTLNGVFRKTAAPVELVDGTTLLIGREVLRYERLDPEEIKLHPLVRHGVAMFGSPPREPWGRLVQLVPSGGYRDVRHLAGQEVVLGREEGDIVFRDDAFMSRRHAAVTWDGNRAQVTDLGSSNGTFVRMLGATALSHGDQLRMGDQLLRFELGR